MDDAVEKWLGEIRLYREALVREEYRRLWSVIHFHEQDVG